MSRISNSLAPLFLILIFSLFSAASLASSQEKHEEFFGFLRTVQDILAGKDVEHSQAIIARRARLIEGARFEDLRSVVAGEVRGFSLVDTTYHGVMIEARTNPSEDAGFLILKTEKYDTTQVRFHTITFMKDSTGQYQINVWHAGERHP